MLIVVCYDIPDNKRRERLRRALLTFGNRVQFSVFECDLTARQIETMERVIRGIISEKEDNVRSYRICRSCADGSRTFGGKPFEETKTVYVI